MAQAAPPYSPDVKDQEILFSVYVSGRKMQVVILLAYGNAREMMSGAMTKTSDGEVAASFPLLCQRDKGMKATDDGIPL